jgi:hypothetical protein
VKEKEIEEKFSITTKSVVEGEHEDGNSNSGTCLNYLNYKKDIFE